MADNVWTEGSGEQQNPEAGLPNVMDLVSKVFAEVQKDFGSFLIAGLIPAVVAMGAGFAAVFLIYGSMFLGMLPGLISEDEDLAALGGVGGLLLATFVLVGGILCVTLPMVASLYRAVWALLVRGEKLGIGSAFSTATQDLPAVIGYTILSGTLVFIGLMMCYLPGFAAQAMLVFAYPAVVVHRLPIGRAISMSVHHAMANPAWHIGFFAVNFVMAMVLPYIPILGYMLMFTVHPLLVLMAYRECFGAGEVPRGVE